MARDPSALGHHRPPRKSRPPRANHPARKQGTIRERSSRLAMSFEVERLYAPDRDAMLAAIRLVLRLPSPTLRLDGRDG